MNPSRVLWGLLLIAVWFSQTPKLTAQSIPDGAEAIEHADIAGATVHRVQNRLLIDPVAVGESGSVMIPRIYASLKSVQWARIDEEKALQLQVEPEVWILSWQTSPKRSKRIVLRFDQQPRLASELEPVTATGDGSIMLLACKAVTAGEKVRFEPQTFKNTVGYWTGKQDTATWQIQVDQPGEFNLAILQGCGTGQGGSTASIRIQRDGEIASQIEFEVLETGHFQNFQWRQIGTVAVAQAGVFELRVAPIEIEKNALMDVRAIHLVRLPPAKK